MENFNRDYRPETQKRIDSGELKEILVNGDAVNCPFYMAPITVDGNCFHFPLIKDENTNGVRLPGEENKLHHVKKACPHGFSVIYHKSNMEVAGVLCSYPKKI
jgi:hypothetical protein